MPSGVFKAFTSLFDAYRATRIERRIPSLELDSHMNAVEVPVNLNRCRTDAG